MDNGPSCARLLHFSGQPRSICFFLVLYFLPPPPFKPPSPALADTHTSSQFESNERKAMCLVQLLNSCMVCVSWGGCTSVASPSIRPMHGPQTSKYKDDIYLTFWKGHGKRWMDMESVSVTDKWIKMEWLRERKKRIEGGKPGTFGNMADKLDLTLGQNAV